MIVDDVDMEFDRKYKAVYLYQGEGYDPQQVIIDTVREAEHLITVLQNFIEFKRNEDANQ